MYKEKTNMSLIDIINSKIGKYNNNDDAWVQFIKDHREPIIKNSTMREPSLTYQNPYMYNLDAYLRSIAFDMSAVWIVRYINGYDTSKDFKNVSYLYVPDMNYIRELYEVYRTNVSLEKSL
jgi:hypothetical protein